MKKKIFISLLLLAIVLFTVWYCYKERVQYGSIWPKKEVIIEERVE